LFGRSSEAEAEREENASVPVVGKKSQAASEGAAGVTVLAKLKTEDRPCLGKQREIYV